MNTTDRRASYRSDISIHQELKRTFENWVRGLRLLAPNPEGPHRDEESKRPSFPPPGVYFIQAIPPGRQSDEVGRWQDDGGKSVTIH
ncbi:MAG TPA: hypothetical protein VI758_13760 [Bacteroidota bacterium]